MSHIESLADWQGLLPEEMARRLLGMSREERAALRLQYSGAEAAQQQGAAAQPATPSR